MIPVILAITVLSFFLLRNNRRKKELQLEEKNTRLLGNFEDLLGPLFEAVNGQVTKKVIFKTLRDCNRRISIQENTVAKTKWTEILKSEGYSVDMSYLSSADINKLHNIAKKWLEFLQELGTKR